MTRLERQGQPSPAAPGAASIRLHPEENVAGTGPHWQATGETPWLRLDPPLAQRLRGWVRIAYAASYFDDPVRPLIRFRGASGDVSLQIMTAPVRGQAEWVGQAPADTVEVCLSPTRHVGPFAFAVTRLERVSPLPLLARAFRRNPIKAASAGLLRRLGDRRGADSLLRRALGGTDLSAYPAWAASARPFDCAGLDRPRHDWAQGPRLHLIMPLEGSPDGLEATCAALRAQHYPRWSLHAVTDSSRPTLRHLAALKEMHCGERLHVVDADVRLGDLAQARDGDWVGLIGTGDSMPDHALAVMAETILRQPDLRLLYGDEDVRDAGGQPALPRFKPDWSPIFNASCAYLGRLTLVRQDSLTGCALTVGDLLRHEQDVLAAIASSLPHHAVGHIRRVLYHRAAAGAAAPARTAGPTGAAAIADGVHGERLTSDRCDGAPIPAAASVTAEWPRVTIVIPTRDRARLLAECLRGLKERTDYPALHVVLVDNGTTEKDALALLAALAGDPRFTVLRRPGAFNYAALCNEGAAQSDAPMLVFLNNDIGMGDPGWLRPLLRWAMRPDIGAVGAKLLYPNGRIQHAGAVLGLNGTIGHDHLYVGCAADDPGYLRRLTVPHEVAAVTGACLAVARAKFAAVGGFDAVHLPVLRNDTDLCLRLAQRGWRTLFTPEAVLYHHESASLGRGLRPADAFAGEEAYFAATWLTRLRDDCFFHPALSLYSSRPALD